MPSAHEESSALKGGVGCTDVEAARKPLARLRCLKTSVECLTKNEPLPPAICYVAAEVTYEVTRNEKIVVYTSAAKDRSKLSEIACTTAHRIVVSGEELYTGEGHWARLLRVRISYNYYVYSPNMYVGKTTVLVQHDAQLPLIYKQQQICNGIYIH